jgi:hypothetical protein
MFILRRIVALALAGLSGYALLHSASSIPKLQKYEDKAKKAAEWSNAAEKRLWDTRYTVGAGFVAVCASLPQNWELVCFCPSGGLLVEEHAGNRC